MYVNSPSSNELRNHIILIAKPQFNMTVQYESYRHTCSQYEKYSTVGAFDIPTQCTIKYSKVQYSTVQCVTTQYIT